MPAYSQIGILGQKAPKWDIETWFQLPAEETSLEVDEFEGKVLYLYCFQAWCPGCHSNGFPTLRKVVKQYNDDPEVAIIAVQTVFEGFDSNTEEKGLACAIKFDLKIPFGHSGARKNPSHLMAAYRTGGTPWTIIIDRSGHVRYNDYHIQAKDAFQLIETLKRDGRRK